MVNCDYYVNGSKFCKSVWCDFKETSSQLQLLNDNIPCISNTQRVLHPFLLVVFDTKMIHGINTSGCILVYHPRAWKDFTIISYLYYSGTKRFVDRCNCRNLNNCNWANTNPCSSFLHEQNGKKSERQGDRGLHDKREFFPKRTSYFRGGLSSVSYVYNSHYTPHVSMQNSQHPASIVRTFQPGNAVRFTTHRTSHWYVVCKFDLKRLQRPFLQRYSLAIEYLVTLQTFFLPHWVFACHALLIRKEINLRFDFHFTSCKERIYTPITIATWKVLWLWWFMQVKIEFISLLI